MIYIYIIQIYLLQIFVSFYYFSLLCNIEITVREIIYCESCGWPIDLCKYHIEKDRKNLECEETLKNTNIELWKQIYNISDELAAQAIEENNQIEAMEEVQEEDINQNNNTGKYAIPENKIPLFGKPIAQSEKRKQTYIPMLQIRKASRGGNKSLTQVFNYEDFPVISDSKKLCHDLSKKFNGSCGTTTNPDGTGEFISLQGDKLMEVYTYFLQLKIPANQIYIAKNEKHHGKKKVKIAQGAANLSKKTMNKLGVKQQPQQQKK